MKWYPVESDVFAQMAYQDGNLYLQFRRSGDIWAYFGVSPELFAQFLNTPSMGRFFVYNIKGVYPSKRMTQRSA